MRNSTLLLIGRNKLSRICLENLFTESPFTVIGNVSDIGMLEVDALPDPDIALVEISGDSKSIVQVLERLNEIYPVTPVVVLDDKLCMATLSACLAASASGFLTKNISPDALLRSLQLAILGETVFPTELAGILTGDMWERKSLRTPASDACGLSDREMETVQCLLRGESNKLIARRLSITEATIKVHMKSILRKIEARNRTEAAIWAHIHCCPPPRNTEPVNEGVVRFTSGFAA